MNKGDGGHELAEVLNCTKLEDDADGEDDEEELRPPHSCEEELCFSTVRPNSNDKKEQQPVQ